MLKLRSYHSACTLEPVFLKEDWHTRPSTAASLPHRDVTPGGHQHYGSHCLQNNCHKTFLVYKLGPSVTASVCSDTQVEPIRVFERTSLFMAKTDSALFEMLCRRQEA